MLSPQEKKAAIGVSVALGVLVVVGAVIVIVILVRRKQAADEAAAAAAAATALVALSASTATPHRRLPWSKLGPARQPFQPTTGPQETGTMVYDYASGLWSGFYSFPSDQYSCGQGNGVYNSTTSHPNPDAVCGSTTWTAGQAPPVPGDLMTTTFGPGTPLPYAFSTITFPGSSGETVVFT